MKSSSIANAIVSDTMLIYHENIDSVVGFRGPLQKSRDLEDDFPLRTR